MATFATTASAAASAYTTPQNSRSMSSLSSPTSTMQNMKALPRSPAAATSAMTVTMVHNAFHHNNHKRGLTEMMAAPPPTPTTSSTPSNSKNHSYLDCQSLQSSLKRVRLSSSPGELRLQRDLRQLVTSGQWQPQQQSYHQPASSYCNDNQIQHHHHQDAWIWQPHSTTAAMHVELVQVESLRLRLTYNHSIVVWIQVPRMYPHRPPLISRIVYNNNHRNTHSYHGQIQRVVVHEAPPMGVLSTNVFQNGASLDAQDVENDDGNIAVRRSPSPTSTIPLQCANTVVYNEWSPVQQLGDLLEFVIRVFQKQEERCSREQVAAGGPHNHKPKPSWMSHLHNTSSDSTITGWGWAARNTDSHIEQQLTEAMMFADSLVEGFLPPNRFDVGYRRHEFQRANDDDAHMDGASTGDQHHHHVACIQQDSSSMDLM